VPEWPPGVRHHVLHHRQVPSQFFYYVVLSLQWPLTPVVFFCFRSTSIKRP
jgi:hypothetical protein